MNDERKLIFLVDDSDTTLILGRNALSAFYRVVTFNSGTRLLKALEKAIPNLILLDVEMPEMGGKEVIRALKSNPNLAHIPVIFLTAMNDEESELQGLDLGAHDYIAKPISPLRLQKRVQLCLLLEAQKQELTNYSEKLEEIVDKRTQSVIELRNVVLETMSYLVECRDHFTGSHIERTKEYIKVFLSSMKTRAIYMDEMSTLDEQLVIFSSQLHDVGKIGTADSILLKPGKLDANEFDRMKHHAVLGGQIIEHLKDKSSDSAFLEYAMTFALYHHEKWDGSGYPFGLKQYDIPLLGRIMAIVDVYDALISERPYKKALPHSVAVEIIHNESGKAFDPLLVNLFDDISLEFENIAKII